MSTSLSTKIITLALLLAASINLGYDFYRMHQEYVELERMYKEHGIVFCTMGPATHVRAHMFIELLLSLAFVGSLLKGSTSTLLSVVGLAGATIIYILWRQVYFDVAEASGSEMKYVEHIANLMNANYLDIAIAATIAFLILAHLDHARNLVRASIDPD